MYQVVLAVLLGGLATACSNVKYLPEGENLYVEGQVELKADTSFPKRYIDPLETRLEELLTPQPNSSILGIRPKLWLYNIAGETDKQRGLKHWMREKAGEAPVLLNDVDRAHNEALIVNRLENFGFFNAEASSDTVIKNRKASIHYQAIPHQNYKISRVEFLMDSSSNIGKAIMNTRAQSLLNVGSPYNLDVIIKERERIDNELKNRGYYYFNPDYLLVQADSTVGNHQVALQLKIKPDAPQQAMYPYTIENIYIFPDYSLRQGGYQLASPDSASFYKGYYIIDPDHSFRNFALANTMFFHSGDLYNRYAHSTTISQLVGMGTFKFVKNNFVPTRDPKDHKLDVYYYLTPQQKKGMRLELIGKTASVYNGAEANLSWRNRNAFKSGELLRISVFGGYEVQTGGNVNLKSSFIRYGAEANLSFPRLIVPFKWTPTRQFVPHTNIMAGYEFMNRTHAYHLNSMKAAFGYSWKENIRKEHTLDVISVGYVKPSKVTDSYQEELEKNPNLRHAIERQFTIGPSYSFTYTNTMDNRKNTQYFKGSLELSGNIPGLINGSDYREGKVYEMFNAVFSQYIKTELDFRNYLQLSPKNTLATRAFLGYGYSYGNTNVLPYVKQFFAGGPNSLRAFRARTLGPGSYYPERIGENNFVPDMTGDIRIELNAEYRSKLFSIVEGALFVDAGNIWLQHEDPNKPGAAFSKDFLSEMAVGAGLGLRFDLSFLVLRTDMALPLRLPYNPKGQRWVMDKIDFGDKQWRKNNLVFNLAIGYPF